MSDYIYILKDENNISVGLNVEHDKVFGIGEKVYEVNTQAYMNGYNWEAFLHYYLEKYASDVAEGMNIDAEAGAFIAFYKTSFEAEKRANKLVEIIRSFIEHEEELYRIIRDEGDNIEWDEQVKY